MIGKTDHSTGWYAMKLQTLRALLQIQASGSVRSAAQALHISQPALSQAIQQLEQELGASLLTRHQTGTGFTPYGEALLKRARLMLSEAQRARDEIAQMRGHWEGWVRLAASPAMSLSIVPQALRPFMKRYPKVRVHCVDGVVPMINPALRSGELDFALTPIREADLEAGLSAEPLVDREVVVVAHASHPLVGATRLDQLVRARWVHATPSQGPGAVIETAFEALGLPVPVPVMVCESVLALPDMLVDTDLISTLPRVVYERVRRSHGLKRIALKDTLPKLRIAIVRNEQIPLTPAVEALLSWVRAAAQSK